MTKQQSLYGLVLCALSALTKSGVHAANATTRSSVAPSATSTAAASPTKIKDCVYGEWTSWSLCSATCGGGFQTRKSLVEKFPWRPDFRCGPSFDNAPCNPNDWSHSCCSNTGHCGPYNSDSYCSCIGCANYTKLSVVRNDDRCGPQYPAPSGMAAQCDPNGIIPCCSAFGWCGNQADHCEGQLTVDYRDNPGDICLNVKSEIQICNKESCDASPQALNMGEKALPTCTYSVWSAWSSCSVSCGGGTRSRQQDVTSNPWRKDFRCGSDFDGAECNPNDRRHSCCSNYGYCASFDQDNYCTCTGCVNYTVTSVVRSDSRCGPEFPAPNGQPAQCDPNGRGPCCSSAGWCGASAGHCECDGCVDFRVSPGNICPIPSDSEPCNTDACPSRSPIPTTSAAPTTAGPSSTASTTTTPTSPIPISWRTDNRCGKYFPSPSNDSAPGQCNLNGPLYCCSPIGYCGSTAKHCSCTQAKGCVNYAHDDPTDVANFDRCGPNFPVRVYDEVRPGQCNPAGPHPCCSPAGYCGNTTDHCNCPGCIKYNSNP